MTVIDDHMVRIYNERDDNAVVLVEVSVLRGLCAIVFFFFVKQISIVTFVYVLSNLNTLR